MLELGCRRVLLLQGPAGPFFRRLGEELRSTGVSVTKVNFHAGDGLFYPGPHAVPFRGSLEEWPTFIRSLLVERRIDGIMLFGDCRRLHREAISVARDLGIAVWVFEEGYLRPDHITLERDGVNGYSRMSRDPEAYRASARHESPPVPPPEPTGPSFGRAVWYSTLNALAFTLFRHRYPNYVHHRPLNAWWHTAVWIRGAARKLYFGLRERGLLEQIVEHWPSRYFFVPLQVHCDFQLVHSPYEEMSDFVREVVATFAREAPADHAIVFKHHPMDRPFREYGAFFRALAKEYGLEGRLYYVHDLHLPTLLKHARGTVTINSTVGLSSIHHNTPVKVMGTAVYDMPGLTSSGSLREFFRDPGTVDRGLYRSYRAVLERINQANGNFYRRLPGRTSGAGVRWFPDVTRVGNAVPLARTVSVRERT